MRKFRFSAQGRLAQAAAADAILNPFAPAPLSLRITSVRMDADGEIFVDWSEGDGMPALDTDSLPDLPDGLLAPMNSIIMVEANYRFATNLGAREGSDSAD